MPLSPGAWLNHYEILGHLGTGGMGEVYRARDNKLQREVALKVLPQAFAQDPERVARFRREAQVLAQLNHVNIAAIYSVEDSGGTHFLVMELALGETLRDRIKHGAVPLEDALDICKQIAAGLECAHEKPIVHRDLKPANVKVTPEGVVKILDFGLARAFAGDTGSGDPADSPTLTGMTQPGTILGTAAYMSPEQARGKTVDKRTDIWALGCVLYELLTGKHAFEGEDVQEILAGVMRGEPDWQALPETTPASIRVLLRRCLEKDAKRRLRDAADLQIQIEETQAASAITVSAGAAAIPTRTVWRRAMPWAVAVLLSVVIGLAAWTLKPAPPQPVTRTVINLPPGQRLAGLDLPAVAISPDGSLLAYVASQDRVQQLYLRALDSLEARAIPNSEGAVNPFFSPDGQWVGFFADRSLKKVSVTGGAALTLADGPLPRGASWGGGGKLAFVPSNAGVVHQGPEEGGASQPLTRTEPGETTHRWPEWLPEGQAFLFAAAGTTTNWTNAQIAVQAVETGERQNLVQGATQPRYASSGHLLYAQAGTLMAAPFDARSLAGDGSGGARPGRPAAIF